MYHLLDEDQEELDGFSPFGPTVTATATATTDSTPIQQHQQSRATGEGGEGGAGEPTTAAVAPQDVDTEKVQGKDGGKGVIDDLDKMEMRRLGIYAAFLLPLATSKAKNPKGKTVRNFPENSIALVNFWSIDREKKKLIRGSG